MKKKIKNDLKKLLVKRERREDDELQNVTNLYVTVTSVKEYERLIKSGKQYVLSLEQQQGFILLIFKESKRFLSMTEELGTSESVITFKINLKKL